MDSFPPEVFEKVKCYVYRLIDPTNGETFYVGRGQGNRVFQHVTAADINTHKDEDREDLKLERIRHIRNEKFEVIHVIHRHGLTESQAKEVEAALIDAFPGLTNIQGGYGSSDRGPMNVQQIYAMYKADPLVAEDKLLVININKSYKERNNVFECVRWAWIVSKTNAETCKFVLAVYKGLVKGVFKADKWLPATVENFPGRPDWHPRWGFEGQEAPIDIQEKYMNRRYVFPGQNPVKYLDPAS